MRVFKILQYSEMKINCVKKITVRYDSIRECPLTVLKIFHTLAAGPLNVEALRLQPIEPIGKSGTVPILKLKVSKLMCIYTMYMYIHIYYILSSNKDIFV